MAGRSAPPESTLLILDVPTDGDEDEKDDQEHRRDGQQNRLEPERKPSLSRVPRAGAPAAPTAKIAPMRTSNPQVPRVGTSGKKPSSGAGADHHGPVIVEDGVVAFEHARPLIGPIVDEPAVDDRGGSAV